MLKSIQALACLTTLILVAPGLRAETPPPFVAHDERPAIAITSILMGPDGDLLYGVSLLGEILRWPVDPVTGALSEPQTLALPYFKDAAGPRGLIGMAFDPENPNVLWVSDNYPVPLSGKKPEIPDLTGRISRVTIDPGPDFTGSAEAYATGFPRSCADHLTNSLAFRRNPDADGPKYLLYVTQGSTSSMGEADVNWCMRPERLLAAAVLEIDTSLAAPQGGFDVATEPLPDDGQNRRFGYTRVLRSFIWPSDDGDLKNDGIAIYNGPYSGRYLHFDARGVASVRESAAQDSPVVRRYYDPFAEGAPVRLFATGIRNGYDLVWRSNGALYVAANGGSGNANTPDDPRTPMNEGLSGIARQPDLLYRLERGDYGGHANSLRDAFIAFGGNPTAEEDPFEVAEYPVGTAPDPRFNPERIYTLGNHYAPTGMIEYPGGALIIAQYSRDGTLRVIELGEDEAVTNDAVLKTPEGEPIAYVNPIDLALGAEGRIYLATLPRSNGRGRIIRLEPQGPAPTKHAAKP